MSVAERKSDNYTVGGAADGDAKSVGRVMDSTASGTGISFAMPAITSRSAFAATAKVAGRLNATAVSESEHRSLLNERQQLLDKKFSGAITRPEENRLAYVRWSLDRIEDAKYGASLDLLEEHVLHYESLVSEMTKFHLQLEKFSKRKK